MTSPVLWRRKWEQNTNAICSELSQGRIWVSCFKSSGALTLSLLLQLWKWSWMDTAH